MREAVPEDRNIDAVAVGGSALPPGLAETVYKVIEIVWCGVPFAEFVRGGELGI